MKRLPLVLILLLVFEANCHIKEIQQDNLEELFTHWQSWQNTHSKFYSSSQEESYRFSIWAKTKQDIEENPAINYTRGINKFSDLTKQEFRTIYLTRPVTKYNAETEKHHAASNKQHKDVPDSIDWNAQGQMPAVPNQSTCGSCYAFSSISTYNAVVGLKTGTIGDFSQQQIVSCSVSYGNQGCGGGLTQNVFQYIQEKGICNAADYPYTSGESRDAGQCDQSKAKACEGKNVPITDIKKAKGCDALMETLSTTPATIALDGSELQDYSTGIFDGCKSGELNHAVVANGYTKGQFWSVLNSWGADWGENGYVRVNWTKNCGVCEDIDWPVL